MCHRRPNRNRDADQESIRGSTDERDSSSRFSLDYEIVKDLLFSQEVIPMPGKSLNEIGINKVTSYRKKQRPVYKKRCTICSKQVVVQFRWGTPAQVVKEQGRMKFQEHVDTHNKEKLKRLKSGRNAYMESSTGWHQTRKISKKTLKQQPTYKKRCPTCGTKLAFPFPWGTTEDVVRIEGAILYAKHEESCAKPGR